MRDFGSRLSRGLSKWVPDTWQACLVLTVISASAYTILYTGHHPLDRIHQAMLDWGEGVWSLLELAMQFTIALVAANACASTAPVHKLLVATAKIPNAKRPREAILVAAVTSMLTAYVNWAICLAVGVVFLPQLLRHNPAVDKRLAVVACFLGMATVWQCGLSSSAPLIMATPNNPFIETGVVSETIPVSRSLFSGFNLIYAISISCYAAMIVVWLTPKSKVAQTASADAIQDVVKTAQVEATECRRNSGQPSRIWLILAAILFAYPLCSKVIAEGFSSSWTINSYNSAFLTLALLLHNNVESFFNSWRRLRRSVAASKTAAQY